MIWDTMFLVQPTPQKAWRAGRFWWDWPQPSETTVQPLRAMIFDLDALADIDTAGHRAAFNAAFDELNLGIHWSEARYRQLLALSDERRRVAAELRKRGIGTECDVLAELLVDEVCATKEMILAETILDADITARPGMIDLITEAFGAGIGIGIVSSGIARLTGGRVERNLRLLDIGRPALVGRNRSALFQHDAPKLIDPEARQEELQSRPSSVFLLSQAREHPTDRL